LTDVMRDKGNLVPLFRSGDNGFEYL